MTGEEFDGEDAQSHIIDDVAADAKAEDDALKAQKIAYLKDRQQAYKMVFAGVATPALAKMVLDDLRYFCFGGASTYHESERLHVLITGRNEVWLRINDHINKSFDDLNVQYNGEGS